MRKWATHHGRRQSRAEALPGFEEIKPMVFAGLYPVESHEHGLLRDALEKLRLNDSAMSFERKTPLRSASAFAAASLACCIWRSSRNGWSASSILTSSPPRPASAIA